MTEVTQKPFGTNVIIKKTEDEVIEKTEGGIYIPQQSQKHETSEGVILDIGEDVVRVKPGDYVYWEKYAGWVLRPKGKKGDKIMVIDEQNLLCKEVNKGEA